jgi:hypothetical protein
MPLLPSNGHFFTFCLTAAGGKGMTHKIPVPSEAGFKEFQIRD